MKALIDTNVIIDSLQSREDFLQDARQVLLQACNYQGFIAASSVTDIFYLQNRYFRNKGCARRNLTDLLELFEVLDTTSADCKNALRSELVDFEDAVLVESAMRAGIEIIVTRNKKDFRDTPLTIYSPAEFIDALES